MFYEKDYDIYPRTYSIKSYKRREPKLFKMMLNTIFYLPILAMIAFIATMYLNK